MKKVVFTFGRMNPPTIGHEKLVNKLKAVASKEKADARLYLSHTNKPGSDPLSYKDKLKFAQKAFGIAYKSNAKQIFQIAKELQGEEYTDIVMVVGSDRVKEFDTLLNKYNGKGDYDFDSIKVVSAGQRDPDAEGVEGMSGTKLRNLAKDGDSKTFMSGLASGLSATDKKKIYALVSKNMKEAYFDIGIDNILMEDSLNEKPLTVQQRVARGRIMKKLGPKMAKARARNAKRMADPNQLKQRAAKAAINSVRKKVAGKKGLNYANLSPSDKMNVDKLVQKKSALIVKMTKKLIPIVRKKEQERLAAMRSSKTEDISEDAEISLRNKAAQAGIMYDIIKEVYNRGIRSWDESGSMSAEQCAFSRVNSFITGGRSVTLDADLMERNYRKEYDNYQGRPEQIARRASRNQARKIMGDKAVVGLDVGHKDNNPLNNTQANLRNEDPSDNRREPRLREVKAPNIKKDDIIILNKGKRKYSAAGITDPKTTLPAESDKMVVKKITKSKRGRKAHLTYHDTKKRGGFAVYIDQMPDFMSVKIAEELAPDASQQDYIDDFIKSDAPQFKGKDKDKRIAMAIAAYKSKNESLDEAWFNDLKAKLSQLTHPKGWNEILQKYADGMKDPEHRKHPTAWAADVAKEYNDINTRQLTKYINKLVKQGKLPKELTADMQRESFSDFVASNNKERVMTLESTIRGMQVIAEVDLDEKTKWKMGDGRPRGGAYIENERFWDLDRDALLYIMKDAEKAMKANPTGRKAGKYADEVNDAHTVLGWRKKNGIKEEIEIDESTKEYAKSLAKLADKAKKDNITDKDLETLVKLAALMKKEDADLDEIKLGTRAELIALNKELKVAKKKKDKEKIAALQKELDDLLKSGKGKKLGPDWMHKEEVDIDEDFSVEVPKQKIAGKTYGGGATVIVKAKTASQAIKMVAKRLKVDVDLLKTGKVVKEESDVDEHHKNEGKKDTKPHAHPVKEDDEDEVDEARQLKDPKKEVMVSKGGKVIVIDKKDQDKYLKKGWELAEEDDEGDEKDTEKKAKKDEADTTGKEKIEINPTVTESAASDARRDIKKDKDLGRRKDSADDDDEATPQDRTKLDTRNVIMQLKKAADNKNHKVKFDDGKSIKLKPEIVKAALVKFSKLKPNVKEKVQAQMQKSYKDMIKALSSIKEEVDLDEGKQKPYVSSDKDGAHVMNASGEIVKSFKDMDSANAYLKKNYNKLNKEEVDLDEEFSDIFAEETFQEELFALDEDGLNEYLESLDEEEFRELEELLGIGKLVKGVGKLAKGAGKLAVKGVKKGAERLSTKGKADAADKKAAKMDAKAANKERIVKANERIQAAKERIKKLKDKAADADTPEAKKAVADSIAKAKESGKKAVDAKKDAVSASEQKENYSMERMGVSRDLVNSVRDVLMGKRPVEVDEGDKEEYEKFFKAALKKFGVGSPSEFKSDEEKKKFFDYIEKNWTKDEK